MALSVIYTFKDAKDKSSFTELNIPIGITLANAVLFAQQMALLIDPLIGGRIARIGIAATVTLPGGLSATANTASDVEEGAQFQFRTAQGFHSSNRIPTFSETFVNPGSNTIDTTDPDVAAFITAMVSGIALGPFGGTGTVSPTTNREEDLVALDFAVEDFQNSRRN